MRHERRQEERRAASERASAILGPGAAAACTVGDISAGGARLGFSSEARLPGRFELVFAQSGRHAAVHLVWQAGRQAGVCFDPLSATES